MWTGFDVMSRRATGTNHDTKVGDRDADIRNAESVDRAGNREVLSPSQPTRGLRAPLAPRGSKAERRLKKRDFNAF